MAINGVEFVEKFFTDYFALRDYIFKKPKIKVEALEAGVELTIAFKKKGFSKSLKVTTVFPYSIFAFSDILKLESQMLEFINDYIHQTADVIITNILFKEV